MQKRYIALAIADMILLSGLLIMQSGCKHEPIYTEVCFTSEVLPIFAANCARSGCHNSKDLTAGIDLTDYDHIMSAGIDAGDAYKSAIYKAITGKEDLMPPDGRLTNEQIMIIRSWIEDGAQNVAGCAPASYTIDTSSTGCDTVNITYSGTIKPIIDACCLSCHDPGPVSFNGYAALSSFLSEDAQVFIANINYTGENPMPPSGKLGDCYIKQIMIWINAGYPNN